MNREPIDSGTLERVCSFLRAGSEPQSAVLAAGVPAEDVDEFLVRHEYWIRRAQAQFVVLACNRMMTDGGAAGARYLLERYAPAFAIAAEDPGQDHEDDLMDWGDLTIE